MLERYGPIERAVIETGRMSPAICLGLRELGVPVVCIDARQAHQSLKAMKANKTDPHDAAGLAQLARTGFYKEVHVKSPAAHGVRSVITARSHLVEARVRLDNTIRGLCATFGYRPVQAKEGIPRADHAGRPHSGPWRRHRILLSVRAELVEQIKEMDRRLRIIASQSQACEILMTIPGVGVQTSAAFAAAVDEAGRFRQSRNAGAYFGLVPRRHQSGELDWTGRITKQGDGPCASCSTKLPTRSSPGAGRPSPENLGHEDRQAPRSQEGARRPCPPPRGHHACHAARWHFVPSVR
jgi:transposase